MYPNRLVAIQMIEVNSELLKSIYCYIFND